jgi:hypothetical protein
MDRSALVLAPPGSPQLLTVGPEWKEEVAAMLCKGFGVI